MKYLLLITLFLFGSANGTDWVLKKDKSGIKVYTRSFEGSSFDEFKGETVIPNVTLKAVLDVLLDVKNYGSLFPDCMNPKILRQDGPFYDIHYIQTKGPFPVKDRDCIYEQKTELDKNGKHAVVRLNPLPAYVPETKEMVRIQSGSGFWELEEDNLKNVRVIYQFHGEPGGDIPSWLANSFVETHPYKTLINLKSRLGK
jgi:hypothetical protein